MSDERAIFIANGRNHIFIKHNTQESSEVVGDYRIERAISLKFSTQSSDVTTLCQQSTVVRVGYQDGLRDLQVSDLPDPSQPFNDATIYPGEIGNVFVIQPYAVRAARTPPYPQLTLVLVPLFLTQVSRVTRCLEGDASPSDECELGPLNLTTERLSPIELSVQVRTEPSLEPFSDELVTNCWYSHGRGSSGQRQMSAATARYGHQPSRISLLSVLVSILTTCACGQRAGRMGHAMRRYPSGGRITRRTTKLRN